MLYIWRDVMLVTSHGKSESGVQGMSPIVTTSNSNIHVSGPRQRVRARFDMLLASRMCSQGLAQLFL